MRKELTMEQRITGREILIFIAMFRLTDAYVVDGGDLHADGIEFRKHGGKYDGFDEIAYFLHRDGKYDIEMWTDPGEGEDGDWELVQTGDIFKELMES